MQRGIAADRLAEAARRTRWVAPACRPMTAPAETACCCPAPAQFQVVMPPTPQRPTLVEILLCGHHYRASRELLAAAGVAVYDTAGQLVRAE